MKKSKFREKYWVEKTEQENKIKERNEVDEILQEADVKPKRKKVKEND